MLIKKNNIILIPILLLALLVRSFHLSTYPALNPDEAAIGYNSYSLLKTGLDEHGSAWPLHFKSFGDFKPGGYFYLALPFIKILGLTPLAVRLPNLLLSVLTIFFVYKLLSLLTKSASFALIGSFLLAISPWHIHFSRGAWESNTALSFIVIGSFYFYRYIIDKKRRFFSISLALFILSTYIYHSSRIIAPLIFLSLMLVNYRQIILSYKQIIAPLFFVSLLAIPVLLSFLNSGGSARFSGVGLTADQGPIWRSHELLNHHANTFITNRIIHNKRVLYLISWAQKYTSHFDLNFLFVNGDEVPRSKVPEMGQFYLFEFPLVFIGLYYLLKSKKHRLKTFVFLLLIISPLASSLTFQAPSALRSLPLLIPLVFIIAYGLYRLTQKRRLILVFFGIFYLLGFFYYLDAYFTHYQKRYPFAWNYGFSQLVPYIESQKSNYSNIFVTNRYDQPYILYLFYSKYDPANIHPQIRLTPPDQFGFSTVQKIDNIHFGPIDWPNIPPNSLIVSDSTNQPSSAIKEIIFPNNQAGFKIYKK